MFLIIFYSAEEIRRSGTASDLTGWWLVMGSISNKGTELLSFPSSNKQAGGVEFHHSVVFGLLFCNP